MATFHGVRVNFGIASALTGITGLFQTRNNSYEGSNESIMNGSGDFVEDTTYGLFQTGEFEYVATEAGAASGTGAVTVPAVGDYLVVTDASYAAIAGTNWIVRKVDVRGSNTTAARVTLTLWRATGITA